MNYKVLIASLLAAVVAHAQDEIRPQQGWTQFGDPPAVAECASGQDQALRENGTRNITIKCPPNESGSVSLQQTFAAEEFRGKRVRWSASMRTDAIRPARSGQVGAYLILRTDRGAGYNQIDYFGAAPIEGLIGSTQWQPVEVIAEVPEDSTFIRIGIGGYGQGQMWAKDFEFETVDATVGPLTPDSSDQLRRARNTGPGEPAAGPDLAID